MARSRVRTWGLKTSVLVLVSLGGGAAADAQTQQWSDPVHTEQWSAPPAARPAEPAGGRKGGAACTVGAAVEVLYGGVWYKARILNGPDRTGACLVSYDGYGSAWDEWAVASRIRPIAGSAAPAKPAPAPSKPEPASTCPVGAAVEVLYGGKWYKAKVVDGPDRMGTCLVDYDGYDSNWDEWVNTKRIRPVAGGAAPAKPAPAPTEPAPPPTKPDIGKSAGAPPGAYNCYTLDGGQMNYTYTDVVVRDGGRYSVGAKEGRYTLSARGEMTFTGPLSNATGKYSVKTTGRSQIDLIFNGDNRSSMACTRR